MYQKKFFFFKTKGYYLNLHKKNKRLKTQIIVIFFFITFIIIENLFILFLEQLDHGFEAQLWIMLEKINDL